MFSDVAECIYLLLCLSSVYLIKQHAVLKIFNTCICSWPEIDVLLDLAKYTTMLRVLWGPPQSSTDILWTTHASRRRP